MSQPPPIDYRTPGTAVSRRQRIVQLLQQTEAMDFGAIATRIVLGAALTLIAPFLTAFALHWVWWEFGKRLPLSFLATMTLLTLVTVPMLMWLERRTSGRYYEDAARDMGNPLDASSYGEWEMNQAQAQGIAFVEIALTGPRLLWEAIDRIRGRSEIGNADAAMAAEIVEILIDAGQGIPIRDLVTAERPMHQVMRMIELLKHHDFADTSADGRRIWIRSHIVKQLA